MPSPARLFKRFHTASTNGHLDLSLPWQVSKDPLKKTIQGQGPEIYGKPRSVTPSWQSSAGWMPKSMGKQSIGVGCKHPVTMCKASFKTLSMR